MDSPTPEPWLNNSKEVDESYAERFRQISGPQQFPETATDDAQANVSDDDISIDEIPAFNSSTNNTNDLLKKRMEEVENGTDNKSPSIIDEEESNDVNDVFTNSIRLHAAFGAATGLNLPFMALGGASGLAALQEIASRPGSADNSRKNKRKNFRPRNIVYDNTENGEDGGDIDIDDDKEEGDEERKNSPMDLSVSNRPPDFDSSSEGGCDSPNPGVSPGPGTSPGQSRSGSPGIMASSPIPSQSPNQPSKPIGLSVVRPEILFGTSESSNEDGPAGGGFGAGGVGAANPQALLSSLSHLLNRGGKPGEDAMAQSMRDAFRRVLKLYGMQAEMAENAQQSQPKDNPLESSSSNPPEGVPPGLLSAVLQGILPPQHPPTPPRTPQGYKDQPFNVSGFSPIRYLGPQSLPPPSLNPLSPHGLQAPLSPHALSPHTSPMLTSVGLLPGTKIHHASDYTRYIKRFGSSMECGSPICKEMNHREHFHCIVRLCNGKEFAKKEEMIRHSKWHQKMDEALKYGFRRVTPMDDCSDQFQDCSHNKKQTHYHCIQAEGCDKVYVSTSDVQMHFNYHRKDNAIQREGFLRFRGSEDCQTTYCPYVGQKTTHFHCNRSNCQFTFKNKADMEKHKNYHMKDEQLNKDGFKKFIKHEPCGFMACKFSRTHNHIHCIRPQCDYVLHSSGQLFSHKRKHERKDNEILHRPRPMGDGSMRSELGLADSPSPIHFQSNHPVFGQASTSFNDERKLDSQIPLALPQVIPDNIWENYLLKFESDEGCGFQECEIEDRKHFHCKDEGCETVFRGEDSDDGIHEHGRLHFQQDYISNFYFKKIDPDELIGEPPCPPGCPHRTTEVHYHCRMENCDEIITCMDQPFTRLEHYKMHEFSKLWNKNGPNFGSPMKPMSHQDETMFTSSASSMDSMFKRKRGRPPKNRIIEFGCTPGSTPQAVFTSFKLPKPSPHSPDILGIQSSPGGLPPGLGSLQPLGLPPSLAGVPGMPPGLAAAAAGLGNFGGIPSSLTGVPSSLAGVQSSLGLPTSLSLQQASMMGIQTLASSNTGPTPSSVFLNHSIAKHIKPDSEDGDKSPGALSIDEKSKNDNDSDICITDSCDEKIGVVKPKGTFFPGPMSRPEQEAALQALVNQQMASGSMLSSGTPTSHSLSLPITSLASSQPLQLTTSQALQLATSQPLQLTTSQALQLASSQPLQLTSSQALQLTSNAVQALRDSRPNSRDEIQQINANDKDISLDRSSIADPKDMQGRDSDISTPRDGERSTPLSPFSMQSPLSSLAMTTPPGGAPGSSVPGLGVPGRLHQAMGYGLPPNMAGKSVFNQFLASSFMLPGMSNPFSQFSDPRFPPGVDSHLQPPPWQAKRGVSALDLDDDPMMMDQKKMRLQTSMRMMKDEPVPEGYMRYRFNEDCAFVNCNYREHQTHFHCMRKDCNYRFCDKTRFVQHTARHERLDTLCGDEFQGYRGVPCGKPDCQLNNIQGNTFNRGANQKSSSHFHCLKCDYYCTDTNKVVAHRRQHQKLDSIMAAGFEKYTPTQYCTVIGCIHNGKQTHYHCTKCQYAVLGLSQMEAHKYRHINE